jgi:hypothetical protein
LGLNTPTAPKFSAVIAGASSRSRLQRRRRSAASCQTRARKTVFTCRADAAADLGKWFFATLHPVLAHSSELSAANASPDMIRSLAQRLSQTGGGFIDSSDKSRLGEFPHSPGRKLTRSCLPMLLQESISFAFTLRYASSAPPACARAFRPLRAARRARPACGATLPSAARRR